MGPQETSITYLEELFRMIMVCVNVDINIIVNLSIRRNHMYV